MGVKIKNDPETVPIGRAEVLAEGSDLVIWALGPMLAEATRIAARLAAEERLSVGVVNARFVKPIDRALLLRQAGLVQLLVTMEDHVVKGGFGSAVLEALAEDGCRTAVERIGWPDKFIEHATNGDELRAAHGLAPDEFYRRVLGRWRRLRSERVDTDVRNSAYASSALPLALHGISRKPRRPVC